MEEEKLRKIAEQLRKPHGDEADEVGRFMNEGNNLINHHTIEALGLTPGNKLLEIGMGNGYFVKDILSNDKFINYSGCDFSENMVESSRKHNSEFIEKGQANFHVGNAEQLPYSNESFCKVFTVNTIYFWEDSRLVLAEIFRVLEPGGQVFISLRPNRVMKYFPFIKYGFKLFSKEDLVQLLSNNNFEVVNAIELTEPNAEFNELSLKLETLIVCAKKLTF